MQTFSVIKSQSKWHLKKKKKEDDPRRLEISLVIKQHFKYQRAPLPTSHHLAKRMGGHSRSSKKGAEKDHSMTNNRGNGNSI